MSRDRHLQNNAGVLAMSGTNGKHLDRIRIAGYDQLPVSTPVIPGSTISITEYDSNMCVTLLNSVLAKENWTQVELRKAGLEIFRVRTLPRGQGSRLYRRRG